MRLRLAWIGVACAAIAAGCARAPSTCPASTAAVSAWDGAFVPHRVMYESKLVELHDVVFEGNARITSDVLRAQLQTARDANVYDDVLERDALVLQAFYYDYGFLEVKVAPAEPTLDAFGRLKLTWRVSEGEQYFVSQLDVYEKLKAGTVAPPMGGWKVPSGIVHQVFSRRELMNVLETLTTLYRDAGYAYVEAYPVTEMDAKHHTVALEVPIDRGPLCHVAKIEIVGNRVLGEKQIRDALLVHEGDTYNETKLALSKRRLKDTEWFSRVDVSTAKGGADDAIKVTFEVEESWKVAPMLTAMR